MVVSWWGRWWSRVAVIAVLDVSGWVAGVVALGGHGMNLDFEIGEWKERLWSSFKVLKILKEVAMGKDISVSGRCDYSAWAVTFGTCQNIL